MHGGTLTGEILPRYTQALREEPFAFQGKTWGARSRGLRSRPLTESPFTDPAARESPLG